MSLFDASVYHYHTQDFVVILAGSLRAGDLISLPGPGNTYGTARIDRVTDCMGKGQLMGIDFILPDGARMSNDRNTDIDVTWDGKSHIVKVSIWKNASEEVLVLDTGRPFYKDVRSGDEYE